MDNTDLIKTVRGLDQNGPGDDGQNLQQLWNFLAAAADNQFHAAEESSLRWLLKSMNGTSEAAETLRRYPLTWTILDRVFQRIPLFSLAKSLADRKFMAVLQQTLKDVSKPVGSTEQTTPTKRKRSTHIAYSVDALRSINGCLETAQTLFIAVKSLLNRLDNTLETFSRDKIGAEHIRSLFCTSAVDATAIVAPAFKICENLLSSDVHDQIKGCDDWIQTISSVWDLHLQGTDDVVNVAIYLFRPASVILANVGPFSSANRAQVRDSLKEKWSSDMQTFMHRNFALPGRGAFINHRTLEAFTTALEVCKGIIHLAAPALYFIASSTYKDVADSGLRKDNVAWIKETFQAVELAITRRQDRHILMESILEQALGNSAPVGVDDLRRVCRDYALQDDGTRWSLVSKIAQCETDVFQISDNGIELRKEICDRIIKEDNDERNKKAIVEVIGATQDGFRTHRDLPSFLRLWFQQLSDTERQNFRADSAWITFLQERSQKDSLTSIIETEMSPQRLNEVVAWVKENSSKHNPQATVLFASTVAQSLHSEQYVDAIGRQLFDLVEGLKASTPLTALRWRVVSMTVSCVAPDERQGVWGAVKKRLTKALEKSPILSAEAYEAFRCCYEIWDSVSPDGPWVEEPAGLAEAFTKRLAVEMSSTCVLEGTLFSTALGLASEAVFNEDYGYEQYIAWLLNGSSRFNKLYMSKASELPPALGEVIASRKLSTDGLAILWAALIRNETNLNETKLAHGLVDRLLAAFDESGKEKNWPGEKGQMWMRALSSIPLDCFDRDQREKLMTILAKRQSMMTEPATKDDVNSWKLVLSLICKIMKRPTFHEGMRFSDLVEASQTLSDLSMASEDSIETILEVIERFSRMASLVIKQMAGHIDERSTKYFREATTFVSNCEKQADGSSDNKLDLPALHMTLLKSLGTELTQSVNTRSNTEFAPLLTTTRKALSKCITKVIKFCVSEKKVLERSSLPVDMSIMAAVDAAAATEFSDKNDLKSSSIRKLEKRTKQAMQDGDLRAWKIQTFLRAYLSDKLEVSHPTTFDDLKNLPHRMREVVLRELVESVSANMDGLSKLAYLRELLGELKGGCNTDGQFLAIEYLANQIIESSDFQLQTDDGFNIGMVHSDLTSLLLRKPSNSNIICRILRALLEKRPQLMSQWNIEITLSTVSDLASDRNADESTTSYPWLCKLVEVIIKKHRLRLEGHFHLLLSTLQALLQNLIKSQQHPTTTDNLTQEAKAQLYARLITLICEPTAGAVSRSQLHSSLDSATDAAKRSVGRHMYLILVHYVKLQLETSVSTEVRDALEQAMNSIFDITPPEGRKILNDTMDSSGRAILREMFKRYVKFGKWSGV
ncbi:Nucleolar 27S pre-rRNA processing protein [Metarhizium guizhouense ARSEF 977]|uniref:Nucleolar 27S pre-rRNA processing protein n=1 Tax=Metarhizium guizhouense (strain ARSEF 977) TaxID=1276136 RepID=A0A0B4GV81_METGA|nr:Nucleolar 27S pre-rRNA processing protein [Metarhizium guizhouense ARSEF 977]